MRRKWTGDLDKLVFDYIKSGFNARKIGEMVGATKSAVLGRLNRLGIKTKVTVEPKPKKRKDKKLYIRKVFLPVDPRPLPAPEHADNPVSLFHLTSTSCRYPVSDEGLNMLFCNEEKMLGHSYCQKHCRVAYRKLRNSPMVGK